MSKEEKTRIDLKNKSGYTTRASQSVLQYGVGAMVDFPGQTLMTAAPKYWKNSVTKIEDPRLAKALGVKWFGMPGTNIQDVNTQRGISYVRFPEWYFCPVCRRLKPLNEWLIEHNKYASDYTKEYDEYMVKNLKCYKDKCELVASNIITVCEDGHINDFPWIEWAHIMSKKKKEVCNDPRLVFRAGSSSTEGLSGLIVECENCHASATLGKAFSKDIFRELIEGGRTEFRCQGRHPWKGTKKLCGKTLLTKQRGDSSVYFPCSVSSIVIPTNKDVNYEKVSNCMTYKKYLDILEDCDSEEEKEKIINKRIDKWTKETSELLRIKEVSVKKILKELLKVSSEENNLEEELGLNNISYKYEEFCALSGIDDTKNYKNNDFIREEMDVETYELPGIKKIVLIKKLREVRALIGFSRVNPVSIDDMDKD